MKTWEDEEDGYPEIEKTKKGGGGRDALALGSWKGRGEQKKFISTRISWEGRRSSLSTP